MEMAARMGKPVSALYAEVEKKHGKSVFVRRDFNLEKPIPNKHSFAEDKEKAAEAPARTQDNGNQHHRRAEDHHG